MSTAESGLGGRSWQHETALDALPGSQVDATRNNLGRAALRREANTVSHLQAEGNRGAVRRRVEALDADLWEDTRMKQTRAEFFRSLFLAPATAIAAADRPAAEALAEAEEFQPAAVYAMYPQTCRSLKDASYLQSVWAEAWKRKGIDPPSLLICDPGMRIEALPGSNPPGRVPSADYLCRDCGADVSLRDGWFLGRDRVFRNGRDALVGDGVFCASCGLRKLHV